MQAAPYVLQGVGMLPLYHHKILIGWAIVDLADMPALRDSRWGVLAGYPSRASTRTSRSSEGGDSEYLHRLLLGLTPGDGRVGDHKNRNKFDNRCGNLRIVPNQAANCQNITPRKGTSSVFRGVGWHKEKKKWRAYAAVDRRQAWLGYFEDELDAARVAQAWRRHNMPYTVEDDVG